MKLEVDEKPVGKVPRRARTHTHTDGRTTRKHNASGGSWDERRRYKIDITAKMTRIVTYTVFESQLQS